MSTEDNRLTFTEKATVAVLSAPLFVSLFIITILPAAIITYSIVNDPLSPISFVGYGCSVFYLIIFFIEFHNRRKKYYETKYEICLHGVRYGSSQNLCLKCASLKEEDIKRKLDDNAKAVKEEALRHKLEQIRLRDIERSKRQYQLIESQKEKIIEYRMSIINLMDLTPRKFEEFISHLFSKMGYETELTQFTSDGGKDVIAYNYKGKTLIECKYYSTSSYVGRQEVQKLLGAIHLENADRGIIVTTGSITETAIDAAKRSKIIDLIDKIKLTTLIEKYISQKRCDIQLLCLACGEVNSFTYTLKLHEIDCHSCNTKISMEQIELKTTRFK